MVYARRARDKTLTFDFAEGLIKNNLLVVDRETSSLWSQLDNKAIDGPLADTPMIVVPSLQTTWKYWRTQHPDTRVMIIEGENGRPYRYFNRRPGAPRSKKRSRGHDTTALGLGLSRAGEAIFLPLRELKDAKAPLTIMLGGETITVHYRSRAVTAWAENDKGELLPSVMAYQNGWMDFNADSQVYKAPSKP